MALVQCVDCGKGLSSTATDCNGCNSRDPFGSKRAEQKMQMIFILIGAGVAGLILLAFYFDFLTTEMVKNFLANQLN